MRDPTRVLLVRHGQTDWNLAGRWQGQLDVPLNATGLAQARALSARLAGWGLTAVYSSDLVRAADTARIMAQPHGVRVTLDAAWRERHAGIFHGLTGAELHALYPGAEESGWLRQPPGGEDGAALRARVLPRFEALLSRHAGETVAIVSHGGTLHLLLAHVMGLPETVRGRFMLRGNTGLSAIEVNDGRGPFVTLLNDTSHLDA